ncbi:unnamed protein product [Adineta steineri]|uniref:Uncharacterized protein n=2 Tax=Adineta steineri TaxID=433720 RepID=A0A813M8W1_9BILA|nr:unnamed protein product [Adineta steineri]
MANHGLSRGRQQHQPPPLSCTMPKERRSLSVDNELKREPAPQSVVRRELNLSTTMNEDFTSAPKRRSRVTELREKFENLNSTDNTTRGTIRSLRPSTPVRITIAEPSNLISPSADKPNKIPARTPWKHQSAISPIHESIHITSDSNNCQDPKIEHSGDGLSPNPKDCNVIKPPISLKRYEEVYETEVTFIKKLQVFSYVLPGILEGKRTTNDKVVPSFINIYEPLQLILEKLYLFHSQMILPHMEDYKTGKRTDNMWTIVKDQFLNIEKLYTEYFITYAGIQAELKKLCEDSSLLKTAMLECQTHLGNLYPIDELNCANLRLVRYILLMENHIKHLGENSSEGDHLRSIHRELTHIALRCEDKLFISPTQVNKLKTRLGSKSEHFKDEQLIWHGLLRRRSSYKYNGIDQLYVILLSHYILVCKESGDKLELKRQLLIKNVTIDSIKNEQSVLSSFNSKNARQYGNILFLFRVHTIEKSYEFFVNKEQDRQKWIDKIKQAIDEFTKRTSNTKVQCLDKQGLDIRATTAVNDNNITRCQICNNRVIKKLIPPEQHCHSCDRCICDLCAKNELLLQLCHKKDGVHACSTYFTGITKNSIPITKLPRDPNKTILFGDFYYASLRSMIWIDLQEDHHLHIYTTKLDQMKNFSINLPDLREISFNKETQTFILNTNKSTYEFTIKLNHELILQDDEYINKNMKNITNKLLFYSDLWHNSMELARLKTIPSWYTRKRDSADSGISAI